jgi:NRAMP (natural resistance-associated macrophage protein)-like metal ion transporter
MAIRFIRKLGPGLITGAADDDPSGISTYSVAGASAGYSMLWLTWLSTPMMSVIQGMCARLSMVNGVGLAALIRRHFPRPLTYAIAAVVIVANTFNVGADLGGMAAAAHLLVPIPIVGWVVFFGVGLAVAEIWLKYRAIERIFKWLTLALFSYVISAFIVHPNWGAVLSNLVVPHVSLDKNWLATMVGVLGTTITPYLFFWQSSMTVEEKFNANEKSIKMMHADVNTGMVYSNLVAFFIIVTTAATLGMHGMHDISTAQQAAEALRPLAGRAAELVFTFGMVGTGILAVPVLATSSAYVAAETFGFREGLDEKPRRAWRFYATIAAGIGVGIAMNVFGVDAIRALFWSAVLNGVTAVPLIAVIVLMASNKRLMGQWRSSLVARVWGWGTAGIMGAATLGMFYFMLRR